MEVGAGEVKPGKVFALAQKYFGPLKAHALPDRRPQEEAQQLGTRRVVVKAPAQLPYLVMAWKVPVLRKPSVDKDPYALEVLSGVLSANAASRLPTALVRTSQIAVDVDSGYDSVQRGPGLFEIDATPSEGKTVAEVETAIRAELEKIKREGITEQELQRVKAQVIAAQVYQRDSVFYQAMQIGQMETSGLSYRDIDLIIEKLKQVTAAEVQAVANKYLIDDTLTVASLDPQPLDKKKPAGPPPGLHHAN